MSVVSEHVLYDNMQICRTNCNYEIWLLLPDLCAAFLLVAHSRHFYQLLICNICGLQVLNLVGQKYLLVGEVHVDAALYPDAHLLSDSVFVSIHDQAGQVVALDNHARLISEPNETNSYVIYEYSHWAELGEKLIFSPRHERCAVHLH